MFHIYGSVVSKVMDVSRKGEKKKKNLPHVSHTHNCFESTFLTSKRAFVYKLVLGIFSLGL